jgi:hypothetical protein
MFSGQNLLAGLELMQSRYSKQETVILNALLLGWSLRQTRQRMRPELDGLCPPLDQEQEALDRFWATWEIMLGISRCRNVQYELYERLVGIVRELQRFERGELNVWGVSAIPDIRCPLIDKPV